MEHGEIQLAGGRGQQAANMLEVGGTLRLRLEAKARRQMTEDRGQIISNFELKSKETGER